MSKGLKAGETAGEQLQEKLTWRIESRGAGVAETGEVAKGWAMQNEQALLGIWALS